MKDEDEEVFVSPEPPGCRSEDKEEWRQRRKEHEAWQSQLDESQEEAIYFGELKKSAKELNVHLPAGINIEVDYDEMGKPRVDVVGPHGVMTE